MLLPNDPRHGTANGYGNHGCRCDPCKAAKAVETKLYNEKRADQRKAYYQKNRQSILDARKVYVEENREKVQERQKVYYQRNREEILQRQKAAYSAERQRAYRLAKKYQLTVEQYDAMRIERGGLCDICGLEPPEGSGRWPGGQRLVVDHCHRTGEVRGLLCRDCNAAIGIFRDDVEVMARAIAYLNGDR